MADVRWQLTLLIKYPVLYVSRQGIHMSGMVGILCIHCATCHAYIILLNEFMCKIYGLYRHYYLSLNSAQISAINDLFDNLNFNFDYITSDLITTNSNHFKYNHLHDFLLITPPRPVIQLQTAFFCNV